MGSKGVQRGPERSRGAEGLGRGSELDERGAPMEGLKPRTYTNIPPQDGLLGTLQHTTFTKP